MEVHRFINGKEVSFSELSNYTIPISNVGFYVAIDSVKDRINRSYEAQQKQTKKKMVDYER